MTAEMGLSPQTCVDTEAETKTEGWRRRSQSDAGALNPGAEREEQVKSRGGGIGGRLLVRRREVRRREA